MVWKLEGTQACSQRDKCSDTQRRANRASPWQDYIAVLASDSQGNAMSQRENMHVFGMNSDDTKPVIREVPQTSSTTMSSVTFSPAHFVSCVTVSFLHLRTLQQGP